MDNKEVTLSVSLLFFDVFYILFVLIVKFVTGNLILSLFLCLALLILNFIVAIKKYKMIKTLGKFNFYRVVIFDVVMAILPSVIVTFSTKQWEFDAFMPLYIIFFYPMICTNKKIPNTSKEIDEKVKKIMGRLGK